MSINHDLGPSECPQFVSKLFQLVQDPSTDEIISWDATGYSFLTKDEFTFTRTLLPKLFKMSKF